MVFISIVLTQAAHGLSNGSSPATWTIEDIPNPETNGGGYVSNPDGILSDSEETELNDLLIELESSTTMEFAVVAVNSIGEDVPKDFANILFNHWKLAKLKK